MVTPTGLRTAGHRVLVFTRWADELLLLLLLL
jgi:hypothetical protein